MEVISAYFRVSAHSRGLFLDNFSGKVGAYSSGLLIRGGAYSRIYGKQFCDSNTQIQCSFTPQNGKINI